MQRKTAFVTVASRGIGAESALARLAGSLNVEHPNRGLRCYNLAPGRVITEVMKAAGIMEELLKRYKPVSAAAIAAVVAWLAESDPLAQWSSEDALRGPAIGKQLGLLDSASFLDNSNE
jgi:NAD(P)-dependent dehydrogenase (short-subunit alcohol dehydrogenase family)